MILRWVNQDLCLVLGHHSLKVNKEYKTWFQQDMGYGDFKDFLRRKGSDKLLRDKSDITWYFSVITWYC